MDESLTVSGSNLWIFFSDTCHTLSGWCELSYHIDRKRSSIFQFRNLLINWKLADGWRRRLFDWNIKHNRTNLKFVCHALGANCCKQDETIRIFSISIFISSVRSSYSHPDLLLIQPTPPPPTTHFFSNTPVLNTRLSLSGPLQLYQRQSLDSPAGYMYTLWVQQDISAR